MRVWVVTYEDGFYEEWLVHGAFASEERAKLEVERVSKDPPGDEFDYTRSECWQIHEFEVVG